MPTVKDIYSFLDTIAPFKMKEEFDNVGFLAGFSETEVSKIMVALDITEEVIEEAREEGAQLIVSHHPMFFSLKNVTDTDPVGRKVALLIKNGLSAICMHTNLDAAPGGVNDILAKTAGIADPEPLYDRCIGENGENYCIGRVGNLENEMSVEEYARLLKDALKSNGIRYYDSGRPVKRVALVGGSGMMMLDHVLKSGFDTFLTADIKYDSFLDARAGGYNLIDGDHFCTENVVVPYIAAQLENKFEDVDVLISKKHCQTAKFI